MSTAESFVPSNDIDCVFAAPVAGIGVPKTFVVRVEVPLSIPGFEPAESNACPDGSSNRQ
jgi:hypothetical protein